MQALLSCFDELKSSRKEKVVGLLAKCRVEEEKCQRPELRKHTIHTHTHKYIAAAVKAGGLNKTSSLI